MQPHQGPPPDSPMVQRPVRPIRPGNQPVRPAMGRGAPVRPQGMRPPVRPMSQPMNTARPPAAGRPLQPPVQNGTYPAMQPTTPPSALSQPMQPALGRPSMQPAAVRPQPVQAPSVGQPMSPQNGLGIQPNNVGDVAQQMSNMNVSRVRPKRVYPGQPAGYGSPQPAANGFQQSSPAGQQSGFIPAHFAPSGQQPLQQPIQQQPGFQQPIQQPIQQPLQQGGFQQPGMQQPGFQQPLQQPGFQAQNGFQQPGFPQGQPRSSQGQPGFHQPQPGFQQPQPGFQQPQPGFQQPQGGMQPGLQPNAPKPRIDPDQIPSPIAVHDNDQNLFNSNIFMTMSKDMPPLSNTRYRAVDEGNCNPRFMRSTLYNIPTSDDVAKLSSIPLGLIVQPLADLDPQEAPLSVVDFGKPGPCRCSRCNAYVNPFFRFLDGGRRFMCNICQHTNEVSADYFSNLDMNGRRVDINERPELKFGSCEFAVYDQYCARPAVPLSYLFVIDVSWNAIQTGMLATFASSIKHYLYSGAFRWPEGALVGFITFDKSLHFYNLNPALEQFQMMVVADMEDVFAPMQHGLCVDPLKARSNIEQFLDALPTMFSNSRVTEAALGSAMQAAFDALKPTGGRVSFFQTSLPTFGLGVLKNREDVKILGTDKEKALYEPQEYFWKKLGQDCASHGIGVDSYLFASSYTDVATVGVLSALTGGETNMYGSFDANRHGVKFANDLHRTLSRTYGYDGLLRVRVSTGLKVAEYFGNIFMKNATDVEVAGMDSLKAIGVGLQYDGKLDERADVYVQAAFLYTTAEGQRRVRVHNLSLGIASQQANIFRKAEMDTVIGFLTRATIQEAFTTPLKTLRERLTQRCVKILTAYRQHCAASSSPGQLILPESLKLLPLYTLAVLKSRALRGGKMVPSDQRVYTMRLLNSLGIAEHANYLYPRFYNISIHDPTVGVMNEHGLLQLPPLLRCSAARLSPSGIYLAENGRHLFLWIGAAASQDLIRDLFGVEQLGQIDSRSNHLPTRDNEYSKQVSIVIEYLRSIRYRFMQLNIVRQGMDPQNEQRFGQLLIEDSNLDNQSYVDYLCDIHRSIQKGMSK